MVRTDEGIHRNINSLNTTGGIANPVEVVEQITYLLFIRRLDDLHSLELEKANTLGRPIENRVFPFLRQMGEAGSSYARNMKDARSPSPRQPFWSRLLTS